MSLRDGITRSGTDHAEQMKTIAKGLDEAGVPLIEVTRRRPGGASVNYASRRRARILLRAVMLKQAKVRPCCCRASAPSIT